MPSFYNNTITTQSDMKTARANRVKLPIGTIGENLKFSYGFDGSTYYVTESVMEYLVTKAKMSFDEAKALFDALTWNDKDAPMQTKVSSLLKKARKENPTSLFWFFVESL